MFSGRGGGAAVEIARIGGAITRRSHVVQASCDLSGVHMLSFHAIAGRTQAQIVRRVH